LRAARLALLLAALCLGGLIPGRAAAQDLDGDPSQRYFPETGHLVVADFLRFYESVPDPLKIFGLPITDAFRDEALDGRLVQYFQRARFELVPENPPELRIVLTRLGSYQVTEGDDLPLPDNFPACRRFAEQPRFQVCYAFKDFFEKNGGVAVFGYPESNFILQDGRIVQWFQRARFEWRPELLPGEAVTLTNLGEIYFKQMAEDPARLRPSRASNIPQTVLSLHAQASTAAGVLRRSGTQTVYIVVQDQNRLPVANAEISLEVRLPSGASQAYTVPGLTDGNGGIRFTFEYRDPQVGTAEIRVHVRYRELQRQTVTSFQIWW
jgi:hypothetical protein